LHARVVVLVPGVKVEQRRDVAVAGVARLVEVEGDDALLLRQRDADVLVGADAADGALAVVVALLTDVGGARGRGGQRDEREREGERGGVAEGGGAKAHLAAAWAYGVSFHSPFSRTMRTSAVSTSSPLARWTFRVALLPAILDDLISSLVP